MRAVKIVFLVGALGGILAAAGSRANLVPRAKANHGCSVTTLNGQYSGVWTGLLYPGTPPTDPQLIPNFQPYDAMEISNFDGAGNFSSTVTAAIAGTPAQS